MATKRIKILAAGFYGAGNVGDELLLRQVTAWANEAGAEVCVVSVDPALTERLHGLPTVPHADLRAVARAVAEQDLVILGGGGLFQDHDRFTLEDLFAYPGAGVSYYAQPCLIARQMGRPYLPWAMGLGPLRAEGCRAVVADLFRNAAATSVRDERSAELLKSLCDREAALAPDPVWALPPASERIDVAARFPALAGRKVLAMIMRAWPYSEGWEARFIEGVRAGLREGWGLLWIPFQAPDVAALEQMMKALGDAVPQALWREPGLEALEPMLAGCDAAVAMRLHGVILAARAGLPLVSYEYDEKVCSAAAELGLPAEARVRTEDPAERARAGIAWLLEHGEAAPTERVRQLGERALAHKRLLHEAIARCETERRIAWDPRSFDWLWAWTIARGAADEAEKSRLRAELQAAREDAAAARAEVAAAATRQAGLEADVARLTAELQALGARHDELGLETRRLAKELEGAHATCEQVRVERDELQAQCDGLRAERDTLAQQLAAARAERDRLEQTIDQMKSTRGWRSLEKLRAVRRAAQARDARGVIQALKPGSE
ncbi:MAG: polysaccharide pyruvyl transferase family protein [Myxococcales bacterium]|jgi:polysaccharide pyruvyl transferase CsaB